MSLRHAVGHLDAYLAACQLGITISSIGIGVVGKPAFERLLEPLTGELGNWSYVVSFALAFGIVTLLHVVLGELSPKSLAIARNTGTALAVAPGMRLFYLATKPLVDFNFLGNVVLKPFGVPPAREVGHAPHSESELREILRQSLAEGLLERTDVEFAEGAFTFGDREVAEIMVPRPDIVGIPADLGGEEGLAAILESPHTRLPVYGESLDELVNPHLRGLPHSRRAGLRRARQATGTGGPGRARRDRIRGGRDRRAPDRAPLGDASLRRRSRRPKRPGLDRP